MDQNIDNDITILQRNDAVMKLNNVNPKDIKIKVQKLSLIVLIVTLFIFGSSFFLPKPSAPGTGENPGGELIEPSEDDLIIKEMLAKLREIIDNAAVEQELKNRLHALVDELEEDLKACSSTNEKVSLIKQAMKRIEEIIEYYLTERYMGEALQMYDPFTNIDFLTAPLGIAVSEKDLLGVDISLDVFKEQLLSASKKRSTEFETLRDEYVKNLDEALKRATLEENEALITAIQNFKDNLSTATPDNIVEVIEVAKEEIKKALMEDPSGTREPEASEDMQEEMQDAMQDALDQLEKDEQEEKDEIETDDSQTDGEQESDNKQETPPPPVPDEPLDSEPIIDGNTPYLPEYEKYAEIINQILASYEGEEIPEDVKKVIEEYLKMLK